MNSKQSNQQNSVFPTHRRKLANPADQKWEVIGKCPDCGDDVIVRPRTYDCKAYPSRCNFRFRMNRLSKLGKKHISKEEMIFLLEGKTIPMIGLINRDGERFNMGGELEWHYKWGWCIHFVSIALAERRPHVPSLLAKHPRLKKAEAESGGPVSASLQHPCGIVGGDEVDEAAIPVAPPYPTSDF